MAKKSKKKPVIKKKPIKKVPVKKKPLTVRQKTYKAHSIKIGDFRPILSKNTKYCTIVELMGKNFILKNVLKRKIKAKNGMKYGKREI